MICGGIMEIGLGFLGVVPEIKMAIMALRVFHHPLIFLEVEETHLIGSIVTALCGCLAENILAIHNAHI
jgi:hypothetical protein